MIAFIEPSWADVAPESQEHRAALLVAVSEQPAGLRPLRWTARDVVAVAVTLLDEDLDRLRIVAEPEAVRDALDAMALDPAVPSFRREAVSRHRDAVQAAVLHRPHDRASATRSPPSRATTSPTRGASAPSPWCTSPDMAR